MTLRLGVIGLSEGNGHPYSWSAIFNGYNHTEMEKCGFPVIPQYLSLQEFPRDAISGATVTHVWSQSRAESEQIAKAANIAHVVDDFKEMLGKIDALLLARDDAENHLTFAEPFLQAGIPVYIDKPLALSVSAATQILDLQTFPGQVFSCSALRYAKEFQLDAQQRKHLGKISFIDAAIPKEWDKYAIHVIDPMLQIIGDCAQPDSVSHFSAGGVTGIYGTVCGEIGFRISAYGNLPSPISLRVYGENNWLELTVRDTFQAFKATLQEFVHGVINKDIRISQESMLATVKWVEIGRHS